MRKIKLLKKELIHIAISKWKHELKRKKKRKMKKFSNKNEKNIKSRKLKIPKKKIKAPKNFSFIKNTDEIIDYFKGYLKFTRKKEPIEFDLLDIEELTFDAISILLSYIKDKKYCKSLISGNAPNNAELKKLFIKSNFYSFVNSKVKPPRDFIQGKAINNISEKQVIPEIAGNICAEFIHLSKKDRRKLYDIIIECMQNTKEHAGESFNWWIFYYDNKEKGTKEICFLDLGIGIFGSLNTKIENFTNYIKDYNVNKLKQLFKGEWKDDTVTKEKKRGNGLKDIYRFSKIESVKQFLVITNHIKADLKEDNYTKLNNDFKGTFYYLEI